MPRRSNTCGNKLKATMKKTTYKLQIETTKLAKHNKKN